MKLLNPDPAGGNGGDWTATLPEDTKSVVQAKGWKSPADMVVSYRNLEQTLGTKRFEMPAPNWDEKKWGEFWTAAGRPESPDKYPDSEVKLPESVTLDPETLKNAKASLHKLGLSSNQAKGVLDFYFGYVSQNATAATAAREKAKTEAETKLKAEWGSQYDAKVALVKKAYEKFGTPEFEKRLIDTGMGNDPDFIRFFSNVGQAMLEDSAGGKGAGALDPQDAASAEAEIKRLKLDAKFQEIFNTPSHPEHIKTIAEWKKLHDRAFGKRPLDSTGRPV